MTFGLVLINSESSFELELKNVKDKKVYLNTPKSSKAEFTVVTEKCASMFLDVGASCKVDVVFKPIAVEQYFGQIVLEYSETPTFTEVQTLEIVLSGSGRVLTSELTSTPAVVSFGTVATGSYASETLSITNSGELDALITSASMTGSAFAITASTCTGVSLSPQSLSCQITVRFTPVVSGGSLGQLEVGFQTTQGTKSLTVALNGFGDIPQPTLVFTPKPWSFGSVATNATATKVFTLNNTSNVSAFVQPVTVAGSGYSLGTDGCSSISCHEKFKN